MPARPARLLALPLLVSVGLLGLTAVPSNGSTPTGDRSGASASASAGAKVHKHHKPKKKHHKNKTRNKHLGIPKPTFRPGPGAGQVTVSWAKVKGATNYSVRWNSAPYGKFPGPATYVGARWLPGSARSAVLDVNGQGGVQASLPYGNPVFISLEADNRRDHAPRHKSKFLPAWPAVATPAEGPHVRIGSYNLDSSRADIAGLAGNIASQGLGVVAVQEAQAPNHDLGHEVADRLGWGIVRAGQESEVIFNRGAVTCVEAGPAYCYFGSARDKGFYVMPVHFLGNNAQTGDQAQQVASSLAGLTRPVFIAGDFTSNREPFGSADQAQPVLVRNGYWDAESSVNRVGVNYSTFNGHQAQAANPSGQGTRADYIMMRGISGGFVYQNVVKNAGAALSDHNLIWTEVAIP